MRLHERLLLLANIIVCRVALSVRETSKQIQHEMMCGMFGYSTWLNKESHKEFIGYMGQQGVDFSMHAGMQHHADFQQAYIQAKGSKSPGWP